MSQLPKKQYFYTDKLETQLPYEFVHSKNKRSVHVMKCTLFKELEGIDESIQTFAQPQYCTVHANIVHQHQHLDSFICYANDALHKRKKIEQLARPETLNIWFKKYDKTPLNMNKVHFILELMLEY